MWFFKSFLLSTFGVMCALYSCSQDKIYFLKSAKECKITTITAATITYTTSNAKPVTINTNSTVLLFNKYGDFLIPPKLDFSLALTNQAIRTFLSGREIQTRNADEIYTIVETKMEDSIVKQDNKFIYVSKHQPSKIDKRQLAAIIYKNGSHDVYHTIPITKLADILWANASANKQVTNEKTNHTPPTSSPGNTATPPAVRSENQGTKSSANPQNDSVKTDSSASATLTFEALTGNVSQKEFEEKAVKKTKDLNSYLKILCTKSYGYEEHNKALDQALKLFINEDATVEVSSVTNNDIRPYKIRQYLLRIKSLNYDRVEVEWTNVQYVDQLKKGVDGNYYGTVSFEQVFRGFIDGRIVYEDLTKKSATVVLKAYEQNKEGSTTDAWDVMLSDIGVKYTKVREGAL